MLFKTWVYGKPLLGQYVCCSLTYPGESGIHLFVEIQFCHQDIVVEEDPDIIARPVLMREGVT